MFLFLEECSVLHESGMADKKQRNSSQQLTDAADAQKHPKVTENISTTDNSGQIQYIRDDVRKIFIGGLNKKTTEKDLNEHFSQFGEIEFTNVKVDTATGESRGFAFIVFKTMKGQDNALECTNHVINEKKVDVKKAVPRQIKLFVGGLSTDLTDDDIKDYFKRYAPLVATEMPYDKVKNQRKRYCFLTYDSIQAISEILKLPIHVINGNQVYVRKAAPLKDYGIMFHPLRSMRGKRGNFRGQRGRGGFPPQYGHALSAPGNYYRGNYYQNQYNAYSPDYSYTYGYPGAGAQAGYQYYASEQYVQHGGRGNRNME